MSSSSPGWQFSHGSLRRSPVLSAQARGPVRTQPGTREAASARSADSSSAVIYPEQHSQRGVQVYFYQTECQCGSLTHTSGHTCRQHKVGREQPKPLLSVASRTRERTGMHTGRFRPQLQEPFPFTLLYRWLVRRENSLYLLAPKS